MGIYKNDIIQVGNQIKILQNNGFEDSSILAAQNFVQSNVHFNNYKENYSDLKNFEEYLNELTLQLKTTNSAIDTEVIELKKVIQDSSYKIETLSIIDVISRLNHLNEILAELNQLSEKYNVLLIYFDLNNCNLTKWLSSFPELKLEFNVELNKLRSVQEHNKKLQMINTVKHEIIKIQKKGERCSHAVDTINTMKPLNEYAQTFIKENIERIEYFFKSLHTPREFTELNHDEKGIFAIREKDKEIIRMYQMSTGQRVSLALAIMFSLHLAASRAPRFLVLDEPVANLDDLHLFNLIDIIREFAIRGTQILFTTANPDVAGIFRRKFSFFGADFVHFEFVRKNDDFTQVISCYYEPDQERRLLLQAVS